MGCGSATGWRFGVPSGLVRLGRGRGRALLLVAGGSGIAPLMAMARYLKAAGSDTPVRRLYSSRSYEEVIFREVLEALAAEDDTLEVIQTLTHAGPQGWKGYDRRIDQAMLGEVALSPEEGPLAFVCGPTPLVETAAMALVGPRHDPTRTKTDRLGRTGG